MSYSGSKAPGGFLSYWNVLKAELKKLPVEPLILEYGPGFSTDMMISHRPKAVIYTYEHDLVWAEKAARELDGRGEINVFYLPLDKGYDTHVRGLGLEFDMVFIDGRNRVKCCYTAREVVKPGGVVILHDANRGEYAEGRGLFDLVYYESDTAVMRKKQ